nr:hypothetical protein [Corynebacterium lactis]
MATTITENAPYRQSFRGPSTAADTGTRTQKSLRPGRVAPQRKFGRTGSKQVVSIRGRRNIVAAPRNRRKVAQVVIASTIVVIGIVLAMVLSAASTSKSLELSAAQEKEAQLRNSIEVLERDVAYLQSTGEIAHRAAAEGMVNPEQPAILTVGPNGEVVEVRPGDPKTQGISDLNGAAPTRPHALRPIRRRRRTFRVCRLPRLKRRCRGSRRFRRPLRTLRRITRLLLLRLLLLRHQHLRRRPLRLRRPRSRSLSILRVEPMWR